MTVIFADKARKEFLKLDKPIQKQIQTFIVKLQGLEDPRSSGKALVGNLAGRCIISRKSGQKIPKIANLQYYKSKANYGTKKKGISR